MRQGVMLYVHIPFCIQKCQYCDFLSFAAHAAQRQAYVDALCREIQAWKGKEAQEISSLFIGGGTPSILEPDQVNQLMEALHDSFRFAPDAEQTMEVNPGTVTREKAFCWKQKGINRISMGVQSMDNSLLKALGRIHDRNQVFASWQLLKEAGFSNISFDLMMGLPGQTLKNWEDTLAEALQLQPAHLSCYSLIIEEGTPFFEKRHQLPLPDEDTERAMYRRTQEILADWGMHQYEISNFSQPGYESRHNTGYWRRKPYIGLGLGAASLLKEEIRVKNTDQMARYLQNSGDPEAIREERQVLSRQDQMEEFMFLGLRCTRGVKPVEFARLFGCSLESVYGDVVKKHQNYGLLETDGEWLRLTPRGMDVANQVFADFLL